MPPRGSLAVSAWFRQHAFIGRPWIRRAKCSEYQDLPWTSDQQPLIDQRLEMAAVCEACPVIEQCAAYGLSTAGGFYAGVWLPWRAASESEENKLLRTRGRRELKQIAGIESLRIAGV